MRAGRRPAPSSAAARRARGGSASRRGRSGTARRRRERRPGRRSAEKRRRRAGSASRPRRRPASRRSISPSASATPVARPPETVIRTTSASVRSSPPASRTMPASASTSRTPPPTGTGIPPSCTAHAITCVMNPDTALSGPSPVWSTHGASRPWASRRAERRGRPVAAGRERVARELEEAVAAEAAEHPLPEPEPARRPELGAEDAEREVGVRHELLELALPRRAVTLREAVELGDVRLDASSEGTSRRPSGNAVAVGSSVLTYSRPRRWSSSPSSA